MDKVHIGRHCVDAAAAALAANIMHAKIVEYTSIHVYADACAKAHGKMLCY